MEDKKQDPNVRAEHPVYRPKAFAPGWAEPKRQPVLCFEEDLDAGIALGIELAQLRRAKETAVKAAQAIKEQLTQAKRLVAGVEHYQAEAALVLIAGGLDSAEALLVLLLEGGEA